MKSLKKHPSSKKLTLPWKYAGCIPEPSGVKHVLKKLIFKKLTFLRFLPWVTWGYVSAAQILW